MTKWPEYDAALVRRGSLTVWFTEEAGGGAPNQDAYQRSFFMTAGMTSGPRP